MKGSIFAAAGGAFLTLQGVANARVSAGIGTWQTATLTQLVGFLAAFLILMLVRDANWQGFRKVKPLYLSGGAFAAMIIFSNITAIRSGQSGSPASKRFRASRDTAFRVLAGFSTGLFLH